LKPPAIILPAARRIRTRVNLQTGRVRLPDVKSFKGCVGKNSGGAVTFLDLPLNPVI
jgi:hypothetical protein